jgi:hypothetical protein
LGSRLLLLGLLLSLTIRVVLRLLTKSTECRVVCAGAGRLLTLTLVLRLLGLLSRFVALGSVKVVLSVELVLVNLALRLVLRLLGLRLGLVLLLHVLTLVLECLSLLLECDVMGDLLRVLLLLSRLRLRVAGLRLLR